MNVVITEEERDFINCKLLTNKIIISSFLMNRMNEEEVYNSFFEYNLEFHKLCLKYNISDNAQLKLDSMRLVGDELKINENEISIDITGSDDIIRNYYMSNLYILIMEQLKTGKMMEKSYDFFEKYKHFRTLYNNEIKKLSIEYERFIRIDLLENKIFFIKQ